MKKESFTCYGWPGVKTATLTFFMCFTLGPGAILAVVSSKGNFHQHTSNAMDDISDTIHFIERSIGYVIGGLFSIYGLIQAKQWITRHRIVLEDDHLSYKRSFIGHSTALSIPYRYMQSISPYLEAGAESFGYVTIVMKSDIRTTEIRMITRSYEVANEVAIKLQLRIRPSNFKDAENS